MVFFIGTIIPIIFLFIIIYTLYWFLSDDKQDYLIYKGTLIFQFDLYKRKLKKILPKNKKTIFKITSRKKNNWMKFKELINQIQMEKEYLDLIFETLNSLEKNPEKKTIKIKGSLKDWETVFLFKFVFSPEINTSDFILNIKWKPEKELFNLEETKIEKISSEKIIANKLKYLGVLSFDLNLDVKNVAKKIIKVFSKLSKRKFKVHQNKEVMSLIYMSNRKYKIKKLFEKTKVKLAKNLKNLGLNYLFHATSEHITNNVVTKQKYLTLFKLIRYFLIVSRLKKQPFVSQNNFPFDRNNFNFYLKNLNTFKNDISSKNLISNYIDVKNYKTNKKIISFAYPKTKSVIDKKMFNVFLKNAVYKKQLVDSHVEHLKNQDQNLIANINVDWILKNYQKLKNKKIVYILDIKQIFNIEKTQQIISLLQKKGFLFAVEVSSFDSIIGTFIKKIQPKFIIIKNAIWKVYENEKEKLFILLVIIKHVAKKQNIKIIYENPPQNINLKKCQKIGLTFFYSLR